MSVGRETFTKRRREANRLCAGHGGRRDRLLVARTRSFKEGEITTLE